MQFIVQFMHTLFVYDEELRWGIQGYSLCLFDNLLKGSGLGVKVCTHILCKNFSRTLEVGQYHSNCVRSFMFGQLWHD